MYSFIIPYLEITFYQQAMSSARLRVGVKKLFRKGQDKYLVFYRL